MGGIITGWESVPYGSTPDIQEISRLSVQNDDLRTQLSRLRFAVREYLALPDYEASPDQISKRETLKRLVSNG